MISRRIYGGEFAKEKQFPEYVFINLKKANNEPSWCGGTAIHENWVLTVRIYWNSNFST